MPALLPRLNLRIWLGLFSEAWTNSEFDWAASYKSWAVAALGGSTVNTAEVGYLLWADVSWAHPVRVQGWLWFGCSFPAEQSLATTGISKERGSIRLDNDRGIELKAISQQSWSGRSLKQCCLSFCTRKTPASREVCELDVRSWVQAELLGHACMCGNNGNVSLMDEGWIWCLLLLLGQIKQATGA